MNCQVTYCWSDAGEDTVCQPCWDYRVLICADLINLWQSAPAHLARGQATSEQVSGGAGPSSKPPLRDSILDGQVATLNVVTYWASDLRASCGLSPLPRRVRWEFMFGVAVETLVTLDFHLASPDPLAPAYINDLNAIHFRLNTLIRGEVRETEHLDKLCPDCGSATIVTREHRRYVVCLTCGSQWGHASWHVASGGTN